MKQLSNESIPFHTSSDFPGKLTQLFAEAIECKGRINQLDAVLARIADLTAKTTGITMRPKFTEGNFADGNYRVMCEAPNHAAFSPLNPGAMKKLEGLTLDKNNIETVINGTIDYKNCRVSGAFTQIPFSFYSTVEMYDGYLTAEELTAIYLHELGHAWVALVYMGQTLLTNAILAEVVGQLTHEKSEQRTYLLAKAAIAYSGGDDKVPDNIDQEVITAIVLKNQPMRMQQRIGSRWYDSRMAEVLSDQFATRWGVGASLVKALGKMERKRNIIFSTSGYDPIWLGITANLVNIAMFPWLSVSKGILHLGLAVVKSQALLFSLSMGINTLTDLLGGGHPSPQTRIANIRREIVGLLKRQDLPKEVRQRALADLAVIDDENLKVHNYGDIVAKFNNWFYNLVSGKLYDLGRQSGREELANNRLYELSALLKG